MNEEANLIPWERQYIPFFLVVVATAVGAFQSSQLFTLFTFFFVLLAYLLRRYDFRILMGVGLVLLLLGMVQQLLKAEGNATQAGDAAYYFLAVGTAGEALVYFLIPDRLWKLLVGLRNVPRQRA